MADPPPPPPPHGDNPKTTNSNLPPGKYDIFIIPPHSSGSGFLYLPSLKPNMHSFIAGFASALVLVGLGQSMAPAFRTWWNGFQGMSNFAITILFIGVALGAWALGKQQVNGAPGSDDSGGGGANWGPNAGGSWAGANGTASDGNGPPPQPPPHNSPPPPPRSGPTPGAAGAEKPKSSWQQRPQGEEPQDEQAPPQPEAQQNPWEKAREETRKREAERKAKEAEQRKKEEIAKRLKELREKEARERLKREQIAKEKAEKDAQEKADRERQDKEKDLKEKLAREKEQRDSRLREARERNLRERLEREKATREKLEKEAKERESVRLDEANDTTRKSTYAFSAMGEKTNPWPNGRPPSQPSSPATPNPNPTSAKRPPAPTAKTFTGTMDEETYSYRPYDEPKRHTRRRSGETIFTESSWAPSMSTARTTPPPSMARGPYTTKDPNKIVIKAVYGFMNQFAKTPASQLISGANSVTDGLILRITTEGLFIDDDVRGVPQREWDVKAWTLKLMEVWCSSRCFAESSAPSKTPNVLHRPARARADRGQPKVLTGDEADAFCENMLRVCKDECRLCPHGGDRESSYANSDTAGQSGEWKQRGLHILRATIRDQEGKRYMFVLGEEEGWKVALGLQRIKKGTQVRGQLGVQAMSAHEARNTLETLGWP